MPSPIAHSLLGLGCGLACLGGRRFLGGRKSCVPAWLLLLGFTALGNAPDSDFIPGILAGELNRFHHGPTHSIVWCALVAFGVWCLWRGIEGAGGWIFAWLMATVGLHLAADWCTADGAEPFGIPALWPVANSYFKAPVDVFASMEKQTLWAIFQQTNLKPALRELALTLPLLLMALIWRKNRWKDRSKRSASSPAKATTR